MCILKGGNSTLFYFVSKIFLNKSLQKNSFSSNRIKKSFLFYSIFSVDDSGVAVGDGAGVESGLSFAT